ncbi:MAG: CopG family transcriptional regulator [Dehalococcoidia bacterium]|nr:CopG family transcriptional regulator [Dehalococcoidia bacterium]
MARLTKRPMQIYLEPAQDRALRILAERRGTSIGALIRQGVQKYLDEEVPPDEDPALGIVALGGSGKGDLSLDHDLYLITSERQRNR